MWTLAAQHLVHAYAERIDVATPIDLLPQQLLRRDIVEAADDGACAGDAVQPLDARQPKIEYLRPPPAIHHQIFRLDVAVNHVPLDVRVGERVRGLHGHLD